MSDEDKMVGSGRFAFNMADLMVVLKNALLVGLAAVLTFVVNNLGHIEMGESLVIIVPMVTMGLNAVIEWVKDNAKTVTGG